MVLSNRINRKKEHGFTIVELLIVIVVIAILAAITIVAYSGITARANAAKAQTNAESVQKVAESYNADAGYYPPTIAAFTSGFGSTPSTKLPSGVSVIADTVSGTSTATSSNATTAVAYACLVSCTNSAGGRIAYWDPSKSTPSVTYVYVGSAASGNTFVVTPAS